MELPLLFHRTVHLLRRPATEAIRSIITRQLVWTSMARMVRPLPAHTAQPALLRAPTVPMGTVRVRTVPRQCLQRGMPPGRNTTPVSTITAPDRTTVGIRPGTHKTTANRMVAPLLITVPFRQIPTPASSTMIDRRVTQAMTRKPTRKATQRPISTLMVVIIRKSKESKTQIKRDRGMISRTIWERKCVRVCG